MALLNIPSHKVDDPTYRYTMPPLVSRTEGGGNGKRTGILNVGEVARALKRPPLQAMPAAYLMKFFSCELGAKSVYTEKSKKEDERAILSGWHETSVLQELLDKFIEKYLLCPRCRLPEIDMIVPARKRSSQSELGGRCKACGWHGHLDSEGHKVTGFILKNPPPEDHDGAAAAAGSLGRKEKLSREERQRERALGVLRKKAEEMQKEGEEGSEESGSASDEKKEDGFVDENTPPQSYSAQKTESRDSSAKKKGGKKGKPAPGSEAQRKSKNQESDGAAAEGGEEGSRATKSKRTSEGSPAAKREADEPGDEESEKGAEELTVAHPELQELIRKLVAFRSGCSSPCSAEDFFEEVRLQQIAKIFSHKTRVYLVFEALFPGGSLDAKGVEGNLPLLQKFRTSGRMSFSDWIWAFEVYVSRHFRSGMTPKKIAMTMKAFYDQDLAEEEEILRRYGQRAEGKTEDQDQPRNVAEGEGFEITKKAVAPFVEWLNTAEDDEESSGEESEKEEDGKGD